MLVLGHKQRHQYVDVEKTGQGLRYSPEPSARRSTSSTKSEGAPGRRGKTGTPPSKDTSASAIRRSRVSTNSSTCWPVWPARSASRSFNAASTVIVALGIRLSLSHDIAARANSEATCHFPGSLAHRRSLHKRSPKSGHTKSACPQIVHDGLASRTAVYVGSMRCPS
jgi:hypothetical protein